MQVECMRLLIIIHCDTFNKKHKVVTKKAGLFPYKPIFQLFIPGSVIGKPLSIFFCEACCFNIHRYNTRYTAKQNFYKYKVKTNVGKQSVSYMPIDIWKDLPSSLKDLRCVCISKVYKTLPPVRTKTELIFHLAKFVN